MKRISQELIDAYQTINTSTIGHVTSEGYVAGLRTCSRLKNMLK